MAGLELKTWGRSRKTIVGTAKGKKSSNLEYRWSK